MGNGTFLQDGVLPPTKVDDPGQSARLAALDAKFKFSAEDWNQLLGAVGDLHTGLVDGTAPVLAAGSTTRRPLGDIAADAATAKADATAALSAWGAASVSTGMYADTAAGLAAVAEGGYFSVPSAAPGESHILYRKVAGAAQEAKRYPSAKVLDGSLIAEGYALSGEFPNLFTDTTFARAANLLGTGPAATRTTLNGKSCLAVTDGVKELRTTRSSIPGNVVSASVRVEAKTAGSGTHRVLLMQRNASGVEIAGTRQTYNLPLTAITEPLTVSFSGVTLDAACTSAVLWLDAGTTGTLTVSQVLVAAGSNAQYRLPEKRAVLNRFPDVIFSGVGVEASAANGAGAAVSGTPVLSLSPVPGQANKIRSYRLSAVAPFAPGSPVHLAAEMQSDKADGAQVDVIFYNASGVEISRATPVKNGSTLNAWVEATTFATVPVNCTSLLVRFAGFSFTGSAMASVADFRNVRLTDSYAVDAPLLTPEPTPRSAITRRVYLSPTGNDGAAGTAAEPLATFAAAISALGGVGEVVLRAGDYTATTDLAGVVDLCIAAETQERARILAGLRLSSITKTGGFTKVYQAALASAPGVPWLWEHEVPEAGTLISDAERHPLHRGRTHRLPSTRLWQVGSIAAVDAASGPSWFWDSGVVYFSITGGGDATAASIYVPQAAGIRNGGGTARGRLEVEGVEVWYGQVNTASISTTLRDVRVVGGMKDGGITANFGRSTRVLCEAAGCANDGFNDHTDPPPASPLVATTIHSVGDWGHDNFDDGASPHERCEALYEGCLYEYNGDRGLVAAAGAHAVALGCTTRKNGQAAVPDDGAGFGITVETSGTEGGVGTQLLCVNCTSEGDRYGFAAHASDATLTVRDCRTTGATTAAYSAVAGARLRLEDCRDSGSATVRTGAGTFDVSNGALVT